MAPSLVLICTVLVQHTCDVRQYRARYRFIIKIRLSHARSFLISKLVIKLASARARAMLMTTKKVVSNLLFNYNPRFLDRHLIFRGLGNNRLLIKRPSLNKNNLTQRHKQSFKNIFTLVFVVVFESFIYE